MDSIGLYIHVPYCVHKCGYCDFNSHPADSAEMGLYVSALFREMDCHAERSSGRWRVATIFLGGGTPTTLPVSYLERILDRCNKNFSLAPDCEITLEANPGTIREGLLRKIRRAGYNRISIGAQSFDDRELKQLDRIHGADEIGRTADSARSAGFDNLSLDLMFALPGQTLARWEENLGRALALEPEHLSAYNLTIEPETAFHKLQSRGKLVMPSEDFQALLYKKTLKTLKTSGYRHYEISNYCLPGRECKHNLNYWRNGPYLGLGAGAASYLDGTRYKNWNLPSRYIREVMKNGAAAEFSERLDPSQAMGETLMLGLRLLKGIRIGEFERRFGASFSRTYEKPVSALLQNKMIHMRGGRVALSRKGLYLADSVILEFMS
ncbi:MAG: radical SAM family heme chaperone HemW [Nitrospinae bacterium]|nr:radical SAM family heme chaperone HemW [Nitrospinota bacterium]